MYIIMDRTLAMYSLHETCNVVNDQQHPCTERTTKGFPLFIHLHHADIGGGVLTLGTPKSSCS